MQKQCSRCKTTKYATEFLKDKNAKDGYRNQCLECSRQYWKAYYSKNPDKYEAVKERSRKNVRPAYKRHGLTSEAFDLLYSQEGGKCHVCKISEARAVDHDHNCCSGSYSCGSCIRGLLCANCNTAIGLVKENESTLYAMIEYLRH